MSVNVVPTEDYVLSADTSKSVRGLNQRMLFIMLPIVVLSFIFFSYLAHGFLIPIHSKTPPYLVKHVRVAFSPILSGFFTWFPWFLLGECVFLYAVVARSHKKQKLPLVTLSSAGIEVNTLGTQLGLIRWEEIEEIRSYNFIYRYIGVVPKNSKALAQRLGGKRAWLLTLNAACVPLYKPFGMFVAPINIPQIYLPITADELLAQIRTYQTAYQENANQFHPGLGLPVAEGVWPPPPRNQQ